jgi:cell wall-associated NlpC family hydrolase
MAATREEIVTEARTWIATPYHKGGRIKGAGADCATLLFCVYQNCGLIPAGAEGIFDDERLVPVGQDWFCHTEDERYMRLVLRYAHRVAEALCYPCLKAKPGNLVLTRAVGSRVYNHGGIVVQWPRIVHALDPCVEEADATTHRLWDHQVMTVLDAFTKRGNP